MIAVRWLRGRQQQQQQKQITSSVLLCHSLLLVVAVVVVGLSHSSWRATASSGPGAESQLDDGGSCSLPTGTATLKNSQDNKNNGQQRLCANAAKLVREEQNDTSKKQKAGAGRQHSSKDVYRTTSRPAPSSGATTTTTTTDEAQSWRYRYFEEMEPGYRVRVIDASFDERLANVLHTITSTRPVNIDFFTYNSGDAREDAHNMRLAAGPGASNERCGRHLDEMLAQLEEINEKLAHKRANESAVLHFDEKHLRLARVLDSYGRYEAGHLSGKQHSIGQWDQCVTTHLLFENNNGEQQQQQLERVKAGFCWARMDLGRYLNHGLKTRTKTAFESAEHPLNVGICLPRSCHSLTFEANRERIQRLVDSQFRLPKSIYIEETLRVDSLYCPVDSESEYARVPLAGRLALAFFAGWLALTLYATLTHTQKHASRRSSSALMECLDLRSSWSEFVGEHEDPAEAARHESLVRQRKVELDALNPVKVMGCVFVVIGHSLVLQCAVAQDGLKAFYMIESDPVLLLMVVGTVVVDTFFVITGVLLGYVVMQRANRAASAKVVVSGPGDKGEPNQPAAPVQRQNGSPPQTTTTNNQPEVAKQQTGSSGGHSQARLFFTQWAKFAVARHLRLVPLFFLVFWFKKSVMISYFSPWPLWDAGFNRDTNYGACRRESWSTPFGVMAAFLPLSKQCIPQAWSVATDLFFSLTIPPIMLLMPRKPRLAFGLSVVLILVSNLWALSAYLSVDPHMAYEMNDLRAHGFAFMFGSIHHLYTYPHFRFCSILIGLMAGYYLYHFGQQPDTLKQWPRWFRGPATKLSIAIILAIILGFSNLPHMKYYIAPHHQSVFTNLFTTGRIVWALSNAVLFMRMASDWRRSFLMRMSTGRFWRALVRLNLALLLIHMDVLLYFMASSTSLGYFGKQNILIQFGHAYFYSIPLAILLHVVYENPIDKLTRRFVMPKLFA